MSSLAEQLIIQYFIQYTEGCDSIECQESECRSNPFFTHTFKNANEAAYSAIKAALKHPFEDHLCPGVSLIKTNHKLREDLMILDKTILKIIHEDKPVLHARNTIELLMNPDLFPFILLTNEDKISPQNFAISDDLINDFIKLIQKYEMPREPFRQMSQNLFNANCNTYHHIRALILLFCFEPFYTNRDDSSFGLFGNLISHIVGLNPKTRNLFFVALQNLPRVLQQILDICQNVITLYILNQNPQNINPTSTFFSNIAIFLFNLREVSSFQSSSPLPSSKFTNDEYTRLIDPNKFCQYRMNAIPTYNTLFSNPAILSLQFKNTVFKFEQTINRQREIQNAAREQVMQGNIFDRNQFIRNIHLQLRVHRNNLIQDTIDEVSQMRDSHLNRPLMVSFIGEEALDAGGVSREYFQLLTEQLFSPDYGMFVLVKNKYYWFNSLSRELGVMPIYYRTLGTVVALAVYNENILPIRFPMLLYKKLLGKQLTLTDLQEFDPELAKSMIDMINMKRKGENIADLYLNFCVTEDKLGTAVEIPLIPNGEQIDVTNDNVEKYIEALIEYKTNKSVQSQFDAFSAGFKKLFNGQTFQLFAPDELDILVSGEEVFDWEELQTNAKYKDGYTSKSRVVKWFWEVFNGFSTEMKRKFLMFTTGSDRAPVGGLANVEITIQKVNDPSKLPVSHTCFNILCLPNYTRKSDLKRKLEIALTQTEGFGLI